MLLGRGDEVEGTVFVPGVVVGDEALHQFSRLFPGGRPCRAVPGVDVEVVLEQDDLLGSGVDILRQDSQDLGVIKRGPLPCGPDINLPPSFQWSIPHEGGDAPATDVFVVLYYNRYGVGVHGGGMMIDELFYEFIETDQRVGGIARTLVNLQDIFHRRYESGIFIRRNTPPFDQPGFEVVFFLSLPHGLR